MRFVTFDALTAGATGAASGVSTAPIEGKIEMVYVKTPASPKTGSTVVIATAGQNNYPPAETILSLAASKTSGWYHPTEPLMDNTGVALTYDGTHPLVSDIGIHDYVTVTVAGATQGDIYQVWILISD